MQYGDNLQKAVLVCSILFFIVVVIFLFVDEERD